MSNPTECESRALESLNIAAPSLRDALAWAVRAGWPAGVLADRAHALLALEKTVAKAKA